ncbi:MAG: GNAT family N-acetyltransferase [Eubacteriales bacterium]|nr:GNAT family N-acetyltransferase [Eubacteriales bacterium]
MKNTVSKYEDIEIRGALLEEAEEIAAVEAECFPEAEAASLEEIRGRMVLFPENFLVARADGRIIGFINGCTTDKPVLGDELYHDPSLHKKDGDIQTVFGLDVLPEYRRRGIAGRLLRTLCELSRERGKKAVILTCKEYLIPFYESCGFVNHGLSGSQHGGAVWYDMQQWFDEKQ